MVLDACVSNSGREFQKLVSSQEFINELRPLVSRNDQVGEKIRGLIKKWSKEFEDEAELSLIVRYILQNMKLVTKFNFLVSIIIYDRQGRIFRQKSQNLRNV